jgi:hypothetical protein
MSVSRPKGRLFLCLENAYVGGMRDHMNNTRPIFLWLIGQEYQALEEEWQAILAQWGLGPLENETILISDQSAGLVNSQKDLWVFIGPGSYSLEKEAPDRGPDFLLPDPTVEKLWGLLMAWKTGLAELGQPWGEIPPKNRDVSEREKALEVSDGPTPKESLVLGQLVTGESNKGIAFNLGLSVSTVKFHLKKSYGQDRCAVPERSASRSHPPGLGEPMI